MKSMVAWVNKSVSTYSQAVLKLARCIRMAGIIKSCMVWLTDPPSQAAPVYQEGEVPDMGGRDAHDRWPVISGEVQRLRYLHKGWLE